MNLNTPIEDGYYWARFLDNEEWSPVEIDCILRDPFPITVLGDDCSYGLNRFEFGLKIERRR